MERGTLVRRFGLNVRRCRQQKGWSQARLAIEADLDRTYVTEIESGRRNPTLEVVQKIAGALALDVRVLFAPTDDGDDPFSDGAQPDATSGG